MELNYATAFCINPITFPPVKRHLAKSLATIFSTSLNYDHKLRKSLPCGGMFSYFRPYLTDDSLYFWYSESSYGRSKYWQHAAEVSDLLRRIYYLIQEILRGRITVPPELEKEGCPISQDILEKYHTMIRDLSDIEMEIEILFSVSAYENIVASYIAGVPCMNNVFQAIIDGDRSTIWQDRDTQSLQTLPSPSTGKYSWEQLVYYAHKFYEEGKGFSIQLQRSLISFLTTMLANF